MTDNAAVKFVEEDGNWYLEGLILPFGGPVNGQDLTGTHFAKSTDFCLDWFPEGGRPGLYAHGFDQTLGTSVVGRETKSWKDDKGVWLRAQIDKAHQYAAEIKELVEAGLVSLSSGAVDHLVRIATKSGEIQRWPWVEWSIVPNPANPEAVLYQVKSTDAIVHVKETAGDEPVLRIEEAVKGLPADDAAWASELRGCLVQLLASETDDPEQMRLLRQSLSYLDRFIAAETDEIGPTSAPMPMDTASNEDTNPAYPMPPSAYLSADRAVRDLPLTPQSLHDAAIASGAKCASETPQAEPVLAIRESVTVPAVDLVALRSELAAVGRAAIKEQTGI